MPDRTNWLVRAFVIGPRTAWSNGPWPGPRIGLRMVRGKAEAR